MHKTNQKLAAAMVAIGLLGFAPDLSAKISKKQKEELTGYVEKSAASQDPETRQAILLVRGAVADSKSKKELKALESDEDARTRLAASLAMVFAGDRKAPIRVAEEITRQGGAYGLLRTMVAPLDDADEKKVVEALLSGAKDGVRNDVYRYLAEQRSPTLFDLALKGLESSDPKTRGAAAQALVSAERSDALAKIAPLSKAKDEGVRKEALQIILAFSDSPETIVDAKKHLVTATQDASAKIREPAAIRLLELGDASGLPVMLSIAKAEEKPAGVAAVLGKLLDADAKPKFADVEQWLASEDPTVKLRANQLAAASGDAKFIGQLVEMYGSTEFDDRLIAVKSIGYADDKRATNVLTQSLFEARNDIRTAAAEGLVEYANPATLPALKRALTGERDKKIKLTVVDAIGAIGGADALQILRFQVTSNDLETKKRIIEAIRATGMKKGAKALEVLLRDRNNDVQWRAFLAALALDQSVAKPMFATVFRNPPGDFMDDVDELDAPLRKVVYRYLLEETSGSMRSKAAANTMRRGEFDDVLYEIVQSSTADTSLRRDIIHHLGNRANKKDLIVLERVARGKSPSLARAAAWMLTRHPDKSLEASYRGYLSSKDEALRAIAALGLVTVWQ